MTSLLLILAVSAIAFYSQVFCYHEVTLTDGRAIVANDTKFVNLEHLRVKKVNKTHHLLVGTIDLLLDIDNSFQLQVLIYQKAGKVYQKTALHIGPKKACVFIKEPHYIYSQLLEVSDLTRPESVR